MGLGMIPVKPPTGSGIAVFGSSTSWEELAEKRLTYVGRCWKLGSR
jgi:hypothetical protein